MEYLNVKLNNMTFVNNNADYYKDNINLSTNVDFLNIEKNNDIVSIPVTIKMIGATKEQYEKLQNKDEMDSIFDVLFIINIVYSVTYDNIIDYNFESKEMKLQTIEIMRPYIEETISYLSNKLNLPKLPFPRNEDIIK